MLTVTPEFDTITQTWFLDEFEASTLRELQKQVGSDVRFLGYYPIGSAKPINFRKSPIQPIIAPHIQIVVEKAASKSINSRQNGFCTKRTVAESSALRTEVIKLLEAGFSYKMISLELGCTKGTTAGIIRRQRKSKAKVVKSVCDHGTPPGSSCCAQSENWPGKGG